MTLKELKNQVYSLARLPVPSADPLFGQTLGFALNKMRTDLIIAEEKRIYIRSHRPLISIPRLLHRSGEKKSLPISGRAYSLWASGKGYFTVIDGGSCLRYDCDTDGERFYGFINEGGEICFEGDYLYTVTDFVCFAELTSDRADDIPKSAYDSFVDLTAEGILKLLSAPTDAYGTPISGARTVGDRLLLPAGFEGEIRLEVIRMPRVCLSDEDTVDLPAGYAPLLAPLAASMLFLDDDRELAEECGRMYENMRKELDLQTKPKPPMQVRTNGWA